MSPVFAFVGGLLLIWIVANGKAGAVWNAVTNSQAGTPTGSGTQPQMPNPTQPPSNSRPTDPSIPYIPYFPPRTA